MSDSSTLPDELPPAGLAPAIGPEMHTLILGSFPGVASLAAGRYYAHPRNQFWPLLSRVLDDDLTSLPYAERLTRLLAHGIGLWDVIAGCERAGSLDSAIRNARANDFHTVLAACPNLCRLCFNGKTAGSHAPRFARRYETLVLPSSSPANAAMSFERKLAAWRGIIAPFAAPAACRTSAI